MNFEERKSAAQDLVLGFLSGYTAPRGLDENQLSQRVTNIADAFARRMPTGGNYEEKVEAVLSRVRDTHESNTWPVQAVFVSQMPSREVSKSAPATYRPEDADHIPKLMQENLPVPERMIWRDVQVSAEILDGYRQASVKSWSDAYRGDARDLMVQRYGAVVDRYFHGGAK